MAKREANFIRFSIHYLQMKIDKKLTPDEGKIADFIYRRMILSNKQRNGKPYDFISISQFRAGSVSGLDGRILNNGTGLAPGTINKYLKTLIEKEVIQIVPTWHEKCITGYQLTFELNLESVETKWVPVSNWVIDRIMPLLTSIEWAVYVHVKYMRQFKPAQKLSPETIAVEICCTSRIIRLALKKLWLHGLLSNYEDPNFPEEIYKNISQDIERVKRPNKLKDRKQNKKKDQEKKSLTNFPENMLHVTVFTLPCH